MKIKRDHIFFVKIKCTLTRAMRIIAKKKASLAALEIIKSAGCHLIRSLKLSSSSEMDPESE